MDKHIFQSKETVVLTSATLRTAGYGGTESTFNYLRERLHAHEADELAVGSPFDYKNSTLLYLVTDIPEPNQPGYQRMLEAAIVDTAVTLGGRKMCIRDSRLPAQAYQALGSIYEWKAFLLDERGETEAAQFARNTALRYYTDCVRQGEEFPFDTYLVERIVGQLCAPRVAALTPAGGGG